MIGGANHYMKGDVTFMDTYIRFRQLLNDYNAGTGSVKHEAYLTIKSMIAMHEIVFQLQAGYDSAKILKLSKEYGHPAKELNLMEGSIEPSSAIKVQRGPPDWVSGQGGMTYTCEDVTISVRTRLPTLEGCLNSDMGDWQVWLRSDHRRSASMARGRLGTSASDLRRASGRAAQKPGSCDPVLSAVRPWTSRHG